MGQSGVGKSVLAMQVADAAARDSAANSEQGIVDLELTDGDGFDHPALPGTPPDPGGELVGLDSHPLAEANGNISDLDPLAEDEGNRRVLYIDLERSEEQRVERYSRGGEAYEFAESLEWADVASFGVMHSRYRGSVARFLVDSVYEEIRNREPDVVIIDNVTYLLRAGRRSIDLLALMKTLRRGVNNTGISVMLLAHSDSQVGRSKFLDEKNYHVGFELADRVVALCHSTMDRSFRYVKTVFPTAAMSDEVAAYQLVSNGFEFVGMMEEEAHRCDYRAHVELVNSAVKRVEERFGGRRRRFRAAVPSRLELKGIEEVEPSIRGSKL